MWVVLVVFEDQIHPTAGIKKKSTLALSLDHENDDSISHIVDISY